MRRLLLLLMLMPLAVMAAGQSEGRKVLETWTAYACVTEADIAAYGLERCFQADTLSDAVFARMQGRSYKKGCPTPRSALRHLRVLHHDGHGHIRLGELVCHQSIATDLLSIFRQLYEARYPIERMVLIDNYEADDEQSMRHNNTSCFNFRPIAGSKKLSKHAQGLAVDINTLYNPYVRRRTDGTLQVQPSTAHPYADRTRTFPYKITSDDLLVRLFLQHGFHWGGSWRTVKDYQHFEK